jgi:hypothetical protein
MNQILIIRDLLDYVNLDDVIRTGDVGRMLKLLPHLLFWYHGGRNWKYAIELLELLQGLNREWPEDLRCVSYPHFLNKCLNSISLADNLFFVIAG